MKISTLKNWLDSSVVDLQTKAELISLTDSQEIEDRFYRNLEFGTGGLRGKMGAGNNRMNLYVVGKATQGLASYLQSTVRSPSVCIGYDTRNHSAEYARAAACVLCANGIRVFLYETVHPTPMLSWAVRCKGASAGIVLTASHNPKEYNGYKVYGPDGGQITDEAAAKILTAIEACDIFTQVLSMPYEEALASGMLSHIGEDVDAPYYEQVKALILRKPLIASNAHKLRILYTPLHGSGNIPVRRVLKELGFSDVSVVPQQELPDGNFPTAPCPNPENPSVYNLAIELAEKLSPDLIFATDPDCDRIGVLVKDEDGTFIVLTGNQIASLLCDYQIRTRKELQCMPKNPAVIKTIVTTDLPERICKEQSVALFNVLTGFKYIGEKVSEWEENGTHSFLLGFEESYGYLAGNFVRDKDAVIAAALIAEMALWYKVQGLVLYQALQNLYRRYGYFREKLISVEMAGREGQNQIASIMTGLRQHYSEKLAGKTLLFFEDYQQSLRISCTTGEQEPLDLPCSNVLKFIFEDGSWFVLRPSGTEPKMKLYLSVIGKDAQRAQTLLEELECFVSAAIARE